jgi:hypothetical protein
LHLQQQPDPEQQQQQQQRKPAEELPLRASTILLLEPAERPSKPLSQEEGPARVVVTRGSERSGRRRSSGFGRPREGRGRELLMMMEGEEEERRDWVVVLLGRGRMEVLEWKVGVEVVLVGEGAEGSPS